jgi:DNA repair exonuclease SbcCD ATPase subunit
LEIEGVAPIITGYANDMLAGTFGPNHSVRFETQDEKGKEVLDIVVISGDGSETLLSNLSGGERVWILKALRLAQTLISQEKSRRHFQTALMDEEDGALSNENAVRFISLYRTLMEMADMDACYYISHRPDAIHLADHRVKFKEGGLTVA